MMKRISLLGTVIPLLTVAAAPAPAQQAVVLTSSVMVEKTVVANGKSSVVLKPADVVLPGDRLVFTTRVQNREATPAERIVVTNPVPAAVQFSGDGSAGVGVSVDGGRTFGSLAGQTVADGKGGRRPAVAADVTHLRWTIASVPAGATGSVSYRGIVR
ncbi:hypothetical protein M9980_11010 [Sphingomonas donggukensis]|uniref:DUF11 domain-containing protein n=1 Tax=Sphingomonas donggukensis TaxID=2949093 RepID=A0ABY4TTC3_9SPHN|nr:hypothetical protein [Sphingomonas donggukensis]URW75085.1 hypothetical protein M9980_11010 [Sphingomonas donggukensis]